MNKFSFWLVWGVGAGPLVLAIFMYFSGWFVPEARSHEGELLTQEHIDSWQLPVPVVGKAAFQWKIVLTETAECRERCVLRASQLEKLHVALGKDRDRVVFWHVGGQTEEIDSIYIDEIGDAVWIVDPMGNLVLRYGLDVEPKLLLKDLRRLLKVSRVG